jgi:hypothetical protein
MSKADRRASQRRRGARQQRKAIKQARRRRALNWARVVLAGAVGGAPMVDAGYNAGHDWDGGGDGGDD